MIALRQRLRTWLARQCGAFALGANAWWSTITSQAAMTAVRDLVGIVAVGSISYGASLIYPAAGFIVGGCMVLAGVVTIARHGG